MAKLEFVKKWVHSGKEYRLLVDHNRGVDYYQRHLGFVLEVDERDSLGDPKWVEVHSWSSKESGGASSALALLGELVRDGALAEKRAQSKPAEAIAKT